jgi:hypothetical protein
LISGPVAVGVVLSCAEAQAKIRTAAENAINVFMIKRVK